MRLRDRYTLTFTHTPSVGVSKTIENVGWDEEEEFGADDDTDERRRLGTPP